MNLFAGIGRVLDAHYSDIAKQPLPERWVDLINNANCAGELRGEEFAFANRSQLE
jgi:hypothetical protein